MRLLSRTSAHKRSAPLLSVALGAVLSIPVLCPAADDPEPARPGDQQNEAEDPARSEILQIAKEYQLFEGPEQREIPMIAEPVLRWPNPAREVREGATFLWVADGRPQVMSCLWKQDGFYWFAFQSYSKRPVVARHGGPPIWQTRETDIKFHDFETAPVPAETPAKRLIQMKDLSRRFQSRLIFLDGRKEELRLLPKPLFRYEPTGDDLIDGAMFAFVQGTDPEVILSLEARPKDGKPVWQYAFSRRCALGLEGDLDEKPIWKARYGVGIASEAWFHGSVRPASDPDR